MDELPAPANGWPSKLTFKEPRASHRARNVFAIACAFPFAGACAYAWSRLRRKRATQTGWTTAAAPPAGLSFDLVVGRDPDFSRLLLEDFLGALYVEAHMARGAGHIARLSPYFTPAARDALQHRGTRTVSTVIVGAMQLELRDVTKADATIDVSFTANYAELGPHGEEAQWVEETWTLRRAATARSRPPERARTIDCPACGAALDRIVLGKCGYCAREVDGHAHDWRVERIEVTASGRRGPILTGDVIEVGTDLPTIVSPNVAENLEALSKRKAGFDEAAFVKRVHLIFDTMQTAWSTLAWSAARPFLSDHLFQAQTYWIEAYRREGLRNITDNARIATVQPARVLSDRHYDAITVRVFASSLDYTIRARGGAVVSGDRRRPRSYTEYWTLIRSVDAEPAASGANECPSCGGGPLELGMAGECRFCGVKVTSGRFDWVLARIEQDEVYAG